eukprot:jgi/Botrbrau1/16406/Bobra.0142s0006.1
MGVFKQIIGLVGLLKAGWNGSERSPEPNVLVKGRQFSPSLSLVWNWRVLRGFCGLNCACSFAAQEMSMGWSIQGAIYSCRTSSDGHPKRVDQ